MFGIIITITFLLVLNKELRKALKLNEENTKEETQHCYLFISKYSLNIIQTF